MQNSPAPAAQFRAALEQAAEAGLSAAAGLKIARMAEKAAEAEAFAAEAAAALPRARMLAMRAEGAKAKAEGELAAAKEQAEIAGLNLNSLEADLEEFGQEAARLRREAEAALAAAMPPEGALRLGQGAEAAEAAMAARRENLAAARAKEGGAA